MMTREEAIKQLESLLAHCESMRSDDDLTWGDDCEALKIALSALRPVSRERVEKAWRGEWVRTHSTDNFWTEVWKCSYCGFEDDNGDCFDFCPECGQPKTDEAVEMVMKRLEALYTSDA